MSRRKNDSEDSSDDDQGPRARKRRRGSDTIDIEDRLESLITRVGEKSSSSLESNLEGLAAVLEADLPNYKNKILKILIECVINMPERMTVYTTLVGLLNAKNYNAGGEFVEMLARHVKESLRDGAFDNVRLMVRFLADLVNTRVISALSLMSLFNSFVEVIHEDRIPQSRSDWYVYVVLSALPWVGQELQSKKDKELDSLLKLIGSYIQKRQKIHVAALRVWSVDDSVPQEEYLDSLWAQIQNLNRANWTERYIQRPYLSFETILCDALQHPIPSIMLPTHNQDSVYPLPSVMFRLFDYSDVPEGPAWPDLLSIDRWILEQEFDRILHRHAIDKKLCAEVLLSIPQKADIPLNYMILEAVFSQLFRLPKPPYIDLFYGSLLIELCKLQPSSMPQVLAQATEILYDKLDTMNAACIERFASWFAYHLSNFQFKWSWDDWSDCLDVDIDQPKPKFVRETLLKCLRLSYHQRVTEIVPANFAKLLPAKPTPDFKYEKEGSLPGTMAAHQLMQAIRAKATPNEVEDILRELPNPLRDTAGYNPLKIDVCVQTLLFMASKSFSHSFAAISKFHPLLKSLGSATDPKSTDDAQICILRSLYELWHDHQQMMVVLLDKLLKTQVVECQAVANWIFSVDMAGDITCFYVWEILHSTIKKMNTEVGRLQKRIEEMHDKLDANDRKRREGFTMSADDDGDVPTEEEIEKEEDRLEVLQNAQKNLFLVIFQKLIMILTEHLAQCESTQRDYNTPWYKWIIERLQQVFLLHHEQVYKYVSTLESLVFTSDIDLHILEVFQQFCALRS